MIENRVSHLSGIDAVLALRKLCFKHRHVGFGLLAHPAGLIGKSTVALNPRSKTRPTI
jgi:hypothetical protein